MRREATVDESRIVAVMGATSGIGAATARMLVSTGDRVVAAGRRQCRLTGLAAELSAYGDALITADADVTSQDVVARLFELSEERWNAPPDGYVLCAGIGLPGTLLTSDPAGWSALVETNYLAVLRQLRDCGDAFRRRA
jgi:NADP-dependent 3-hydroxy acid dehydrogenase YdfG